MMSSLLLIVIAMLVIAMINVSANRDRFIELEKNIEHLLHHRIVIIEQIGQLEKRLRELGLEVKVVPETGDIIIQDAGVFFELGKSTLQNTGKIFLDKFAPAYLNIILDDKFKDHIQSVQIVGHASADGSSRQNMTLSLRRAEAVANYLEQIQLVPNDEAKTQALRSMFREKLLIAGRGDIEAPPDSEDPSTYRTVRFRLLFRGDALEVQKLFEQAGFSVKRIPKKINP
jgi:outer membrane protein OmpA-like peptidoglycan-associated protein